jgi:hypothetical protein
VAFAVTAVLTAPVAYMAMFSSFHAYDDEGYYLANLRDYLSGHPLLTSYSQVYGPFFYEFYGGLFKLFGLTPDNDSGRVVTAATWLLASVGGGLVAYRLTRQLWLALAAQLLTFGLLSAMTNEPMATYGLVCILQLVAIGAAAYRASRPRATAVIIGAAIGALCLIKINVGGLAALAVVFAWAAGLDGRRRWLALAPLLAVMAALPFVLMSALIGTQGWVLDLALVTALSVAALGVAAASSPHTPSSVPWFVAGGGVVAAVSIGIALLGGTHPGDLWTGLVTSGLRFPELFTLPLSVNPVHVVVAALSLVTAALRRPVGGLARVVVGFAMLLSLVWMPNAGFMAAVPLAWLALRAPGGDDPAGPYARALIAALAVLEPLQAYPIAGTQASMAGFCLIPAGAVILGDGLRQLATARVSRVTWIAPLMLAIEAAAVTLLAVTATAAFATGVPMGVRGAEQVRLPARDAAHVRQLVATIDQSCSSFITFPGMNSLYVWTAQDEPTPVRVEIWWLRLDEDQQTSLVRQLSGKPRLCVVKNQRVIDMWAAGRQVPDTPLVDFIGRSFVHQGAYGDYELLVSSRS